MTMITNVIGSRAANGCERPYRPSPEYVATPIYEKKAIYKYPIKLYKKTILGYLTGHLVRI